MPEEEIVNGADVQATPEVETSVEENVIPTKEENKDLPLTSQQLREMGVPIDDLEKEEEVEEKPEAVVSESPVVPESRPVPSIDKRIAKLYQETQILKGGSAPETADILREIAGESLHDKQDALHRLLSERRSLRGENATAELDTEDKEAIIEAQVEERLQGMQAEIQQREFEEDLVKTVDAHPELKTNSKLTAAVEKLVERGMKTSEAYDLVTGSIEAVQEKQKKTEKREAEISKQRALSGAVSATNISPNSDKGMTWEQFDELRTSDPDRYTKLLKENFRPSE